jgi:hypothetical protein
MNMVRRSVRRTLGGWIGACAACLAAYVTSNHGVAQCHNWGTEFAQVGPFGAYAIQSWDDGSGPGLFVGGDFGAGYIGKWDGSSWSGLGSGVDFDVESIAVFDDGSGSKLFVGGWFSTAGGITAKGISRWDGASWSALGGGLLPGPSGGPIVQALAVFDDGVGPALFIGGGFGGGGMISSSSVIKWDGAGWSSLNGGVQVDPPSTPTVDAFVVFDDGNGAALYVAGDFTSAGGVPAAGFARWNGSVWSALGPGSYAGIRALAVFDDGTGPALYAGGGFNTIGGISANKIAKWDGSTWSSLAAGVQGNVKALAVSDDGGGPALYAGCSFTTAERGIRRWDGIQWTALGNGVSSHVRALGVHDEGHGSGPELYVGGNFGQTGGFASRAIAHWQSCQSPIDSMCFGDSTVAPCPCSNSGLTGRGCENSAATGGARLTSTGALVPDRLVLHVVGELPTSLTIVLQGSIEIRGTAAFGDGLRCVGGNLKRLYVKTASGGATDAPQAGDLSISARSAAAGDPLSPGFVRYYQSWYRDSSATFCQAPAGSTFNASNGLRVVW